ncbi:MAG: cadherin-like domain-containing protein [Caldilineaceae bacterium]|nr:cadherin-like domain-containing protein [Caldilineaceae bacterium]
MRSDWQNVREHHKYAATPMYGGHATTMPAPVTGFNLQPGINQTASFYLNIGYALPAYECWMVPTPWAYTPVCYTRTFTGKNSTKMETLRYDIFPATFAEFITLATKPDGGRGLAWDSRFPSLVDADGDGLRSNAHGGVDPNDDPDTHGWDTDNDGLSDAFEMERRAAGFAFSPIQCDTDGDGLTDAQEAFFGTNPANPDTDNDGLLDSEEVWHQVYDPITCQPTGVWAGGWDVTINAAGGPLGAFTIRVTSNPLRPDSDGDGIDDLAERQLAQHTDPTKRLDDQNRPYHPGVFNSSPIKIYPETDRRYVRPGGSVIFTNTVVSNVELVPSVLDVTLPPQFGASPPPALLNFDPLTFSGSQTVTHQSILTAQPGLDTQTVPITSAVRARLMETGDPLGAATLAWDPLVPQPLGAASQVVRFSAAAAPLVDRQDHYLVSGLLSDSASRGGNGAIQTNAIPGGQSGLLDTGNSNKNALRGATTPEIACNDAGNCLVVWDQRELCSTITINYIRVVKAGSDHGTAGIEPHIYFVADGNDFDPTDGGYQRVWTPDGLNGGIDMRTGEQRGPNEKGFPITRTFCGVSRLEIYEYDTDKPFDERIGTGHQFSAADFASADPSATWRFESGGHQIDLNVTIPRKNLDTIRGALVGPTGQVLRSSFAIPAALPESQALSHNFRPVVASDGANFLVISELADETNGKTYLDYRRFDANGNLLGSPGALLIEDVRSSPSANRVTLAITWIGDRYRVARKFIHAIYDFTPIYVRDWDQSGSPLGGQWTAFADNAHGSMVGAPTLAYNPRAGQTLLLYVHVGGSGSEWRIRRLLFQGSSLTPILADDWLDFDITTFAQPQAAYNPMADGWLINWAQNIGLGNGRIIYSLWRPDLSARLVPDRTLSTPFLNLTSRAQACPVTDSQAAVDLRFEELPGATTFMDSSGRGHHATCGGAVCPAAGLPGAIDNLGIAAGAPASDYALGFNGATQQIHFSSPVDPAQDSFTIAFWYKSPPNRPGEMQILMGVGYVSLFVTSSGYAGIKVGGQQIFTTQNVNDDRWRFIVGTHNMATGQLGLYVDGAPVPVNYSTTTPGLSGYGMAVVSSANFQLDQLQVYRAPLSASAVQALYDRSLQSYCVGARYNQDQYEWLKLNVSQPDVRGGKLAASAGMTITIDGDLPTSIIGGLSHGQYIRGNTVHTIGGHASDATSGVAGVEVQVNGGAFQPANGAATWAYNLVAGEGSYTIQSRATDVAGNVETPGNGVTVIADATPPDVTVTSLLATPIVPTRNGETSGSGQWSVTLGGTAIDPASGGQPGSGVQPDSVEVLLVAQAGDDDAQGNGWQQATLNGNNWSIDYLFADALPDPTGTYAVYVRASDRMGNRTTLDGSTAGSLAAGVHAGNRTANSIALGALKLDGAAPLVTLSEADAVRAIITDTVTIGGAATDIGPAGVQQVEFSVVTLEQIAALPVDVSSDEAQTLLDATGRVWLPAGLAQPGAAATTWGAQIPAGLEGEYQIDLRGTDMLGNRRTSPNVWRGVIDTRAPRLVIEGAHTGAIYFDEAAGIQRYEFIYTCSTEDRYLVEQDFVCDGNDFQPPARFFVEDGSVQALFPDRTILSKLSNAYSRWEESLQPMSTVSACDAFGHCASQENQQPEAHSSQGFAGASEPGAPKAVVISPGNLRYVAGEAAGPGALPVTVVAEAGQGLKQVTLALDGVDVHTVAFAQSERVTRTLRTFSVTVAGVGEHTLTARATDWAGATQSALYPVTFKLDTQPPSVTLATVELTPADTWQLGSGILRFHGAASDDVGLAAVQIKVDDQPFANAAFGNGAWRTALPVVDPEGRALPVTVRAIDFAGQVTEVSRSIPANLAVADAPDTTITARPENPSNENGAIFEFTGSPGGDAEGAEVATFACKLDDAAYTPCASPWRYDNLSRGVHTFSVRAIDARGYADLSPAQFTWTVRTGSLDVAITGAPANPTNSRSATFTFTGSGARFECALDGGAFTPCASPQQYASLALGEHTFRVRASDETGEVSAPAQFTWRIVNTPPVAHDQTLTITGQASVAITLSATDADGDALVYTVVAPTAHGLLDGAPPDLIYTPDAGFTGEDRFTFAVNDGNGGVATGAVTIIVTNPGGQTDGVLLHLPLIANQN